MKLVRQPTDLQRNLAGSPGGFKATQPEFDDIIL